DADAGRMRVRTETSEAHTDVVSNVTVERFIEAIEQAQEYIRAGDVFQVVLSQRFAVQTDVAPFCVYRALRTLNPSPYMYCLRFDETTIVGASPELLVRVQDRTVCTRPIAGTRPRGATVAEDIANEQQLRSDAKECAEHIMLVDLGRNDIGRVAQHGTVDVSSFMDIERYSQVMHLVSHVTGTLRADCDAFDAFLACMPAGTLSGAPKVRAMEIIAQLEQEARGTYAGAIGYIGFTGNIDTCITIRTICFTGGTAYVQAGCGIVLDSQPEHEVEESVNKAKALLRAIAAAKAWF
ncbi:MAG: anthranilate synthase component I family protein, partial [Paenibacillaceae bacterium]|nr:anthranilate synthase component I family protein [Paenibacillaceae bacterium]